MSLLRREIKKQNWSLMYVATAAAAAAAAKQTRAIKSSTSMYSKTPSGQKAVALNNKQEMDRMAGHFDDLLCSRCGLILRSSRGTGPQINKFRANCLSLLYRRDKPVNAWTHSMIQPFHPYVVAFGAWALPAQHRQSWRNPTVRCFSSTSLEWWWDACSSRYLCAQSIVTVKYVRIDFNWPCGSNLSFQPTSTRSTFFVSI